MAILDMCSTGVPKAPEWRGAEIFDPLGGHVDLWQSPAAAFNDQIVAVAIGGVGTETRETISAGRHNSPPRNVCLWEGEVTALTTGMGSTAAVHLMD